MTEADVREIAEILWHHYAPSHHEEWADEPNKSEYILVAEKIARIAARGVPEGFVWDAEHPLSDLNHAEVIRQAETLEEALRGL